MERDQLATEAREVEEQTGGVGREGIAILVLGSKQHHHERQGVGRSEEGGALERHVVVHVVVVAQVQNHLPTTLNTNHTASHHTLLDGLRKRHTYRFRRN